MSDELRKSERLIIAGSVSESLTGIGAVVLAILGLVGVLPRELMSIIAIVVGAGMLVEGLSISARYRALLHHGQGGSARRIGLGTAFTAETIGGSFGIVLGILGLFGAGTMTLIAIAVIIFGATLVLEIPTNLRLSELTNRLAKYPEETAAASRQAVLSAANLNLLVGLAAVVLGILSLVVPTALTLTLIALLGVGVADLLSGSAFMQRIISAFEE